MFFFEIQRGFSGNRKNGTFPKFFFLDRDLGRILVRYPPHRIFAMIFLVFNTLTIMLQRAGFVSGAPTGTGLEWMTIMAVVLPTLVLILLVYQGSKQTV